MATWVDTALTEGAEIETSASCSRFAGREIDLRNDPGRARADLSGMSTRPSGPDSTDDTLAIAGGAVAGDRPPGAAAGRPTQ
jgi:hypothetical protein